MLNFYEILRAPVALMGIGKIGTPELLVILVIVLVIFGPKQLPKLAKTFGQTIKSFKQGIEDGASDPEKAKPSDGGPAAKAGDEPDGTKA